MVRWIAAVLSFFLPGLGLVVFGPKRLRGLIWSLGGVGLTYVELSIKEPLPQLYWTMFATVFLMNIAFAVDTFLTVSEARKDAEAMLRPA